MEACLSARVVVSIWCHAVSSPPAPMGALDTKVGDIGGARFRHAQPVQGEQAGKSVVAGRGGLGRGQEPDRLLAVKPKRLRITRHRGATNVGDGGVGEGFLLVMVTMVAPSVGRWRKTGDARQSSQGQRRGEGGRTVVFVHPHGASKSRIAAAWLESDERARPVTFNPVRRLVSDPPSPVAPTLSNRGSAAAVVVGQVVRRLPAGPAATAADRGPRPPQRRERASSTPSAQPIAALPPSPSSASRCTPIRRQVAAVSTTSPFPHHDHSV
jgi:hypothetical protein